MEAGNLHFPRAPSAAVAGSRVRSASAPPAALNTDVVLQLCVWCQTGRAPRPPSLHGQQHGTPDAVLPAGRRVSCPRVQWAGGFERRGGFPTLAQADSSRSSPSSVCLEEAAPRPPSAQELGGRAEGLSPASEHTADGRTSPSALPGVVQAFRTRGCYVLPCSASTNHTELQPGPSGALTPMTTQPLPFSAPHSSKGTLRENNHERPEG